MSKDEDNNFTQSRLSTRPIMHPSTLMSIAATALLALSAQAALYPTATITRRAPAPSGIGSFEKREAASTGLLAKGYSAPTGVFERRNPAPSGVFERRAPAPSAGFQRRDEVPFPI